MDRLVAMRSFRTVIEAGGFSAAARRLGLSKAAVSKQISDLESHFGTALLQRSTRRMSATHAGERYYEHCVRLLDDLNDVEAELTHAQSEPSGRLRVSAPVTFGNQVLGPVVCELARNYPRLELQFELSDRFVDLIGENFDAALRIRGGLPDSSLIVRRLCGVARPVCATPGYLKRRGRPKTPADLRNHECLIYTLSTTPFDWRFNVDGKVTSVRVSGRIQSNNGQFLMAPLLAGHGIASLPEFTVGRAVKEGKVERILSDFPTPDLDLHVVYPASRHQSPKLRAFVDVVAKHLRDPAIWHSGKGRVAK